MRTMLLLVVVALWSASPAHAEQASQPKLTKAQRDTLQAVVAAVDAAASSPETAGVEWQTHLLRTSDGAHYVAFTAVPPAALSPQLASTFYVRLATRQDPQASPLAERSAVMEWLKGMRSEPLVAQKRRGIAFGEMPVYGAGSIATRGPGQQTSDLALLTMERERARERKEAAERARRAALEGTASASSRDPIYPFEDFSVDTSLPLNAAIGGMRIERSITSGPGEYDLYVGWAAKPAKSQRTDVHVVKRTLTLPPASTTDLALSSVIVADAVSTRDIPYPPDEQTSHPYTIGPLEIAPAQDDSFANDQRLAVVFQVVNARADAAGKPDVAIGFQLTRVISTGEQSVGTLNPQFYNAATLPADFDLRKGHPLFVAMAAPLKTLARGEYRLMIEATDRLVQRSARTSTSFRVVATPQTLLATAPGAPPFRREDLLRADVLQFATSQLRPAQPSAAMATALDAAREAKFLELLRDDGVTEAEKSARTALKGIGLYALGDARIACATLQRSNDAARQAAILLYLGACRALERNDRDAVAAWNDSLSGDAPAEIVIPVLVDAHVRLGEHARAVKIAERLVADGAPAPTIVSGLAAALIADGRPEDAVAILTPHLATHGEDLEASYALLHALFAGFVRGQGAGSTLDGQEKFRGVARTYIDAKGRHAGIVGEWLGVVGATP
jgi:hypothetical protein